MRQTPVVDALHLLMARSHLLAAHEVPAAVARCGAEIGFADVRIFVVDLRQRVLVPFGASRSDGSQLLVAVDSSTAGRAFTESRLTTQFDGGNQVTAWVPLLDAAERLGLLRVTMPGFEDHTPSADQAAVLGYFASLVASILASKALGSDTIVWLRRTAPMGLAAEMQWSLLPPLTFHSDRVSLAAVVEPAYDMAGDAVDYAVEEDLVRFAVVDVTGRGVAGSLLVTLVVAAYRNARRGRQPLPETYRRIDSAVRSAFPGGERAAGTLAQLDLRNGRLSWVSAGAPAPVLLRDDGAVEGLEVQPSPLFGAVGEGPAEASRLPGPAVGTAQLRPGDSVLLLSEGAMTAMSSTREPFGLTRLVEVVTEHLQRGSSPAETVRLAMAAMLRHQSGRLSDDATLLLVGWQPATGA